MMFDTADPQLFLAAYRNGVFPMADSADDACYSFYQPQNRALLPIEELHIPKRLLRTVKQSPYQVSINQNFEGVITACQNYKDKDREGTWINAPIKQSFINLHHLGHAHSVECHLNGELVGGLYGLAIGAVFCGESMFSTADNASKIALVHLCAILSHNGFTMLDSQFANDHLRQFGLYEIPQEEYEKKIFVEMEKTDIRFHLDISMKEALLNFLNQKNHRS